MFSELKVGVPMGGPQGSETTFGLSIGPVLPMKPDQWASGVTEQQLVPRSRFQPRTWWLEAHCGSEPSG